MDLSHSRGPRKRPSTSAALLTMLCLGGGAAACRTQAGTDQTRPVLRVATTLAPLSQPLIAEYRRRLPYLDVQSKPVGESLEAVQGIQDGSIDLAVTLADVVYHAYWNPPGDAPASDSHIRGVSLLQPLAEYLIVRAGSGIRHVSDLRGRTVVVGPQNTSTSTLGRLVLQAFAVNPVTIRVMSTRAEAAAGLKAGTVDAAFFPGYVYPDEVTYSAIKAGAYLIPIEGSPVDQLRRDYPFVRLATIPREIYPGQDRIIPTVGVDMVVVCRRDLDESVVYDLTAQLFSAYPRLSGVEASLRFLNFDEAPATPIPLHPGAARYFRERELSR
jgi:TRAP transporter TAXI family solute receptor